MTFLSPTFMFVFLPFSLAVYALIPKYLKSYSLPLFGILFYTAVNLKSRFALIALPAMLAAVITAVELYRKKKLRFPLHISRITLIIAIFVTLVLRIFGVVGFASGIGTVLCFMAGVSICSDILLEKGRVPDTPWDVVVYMTFFPLFLAGPFIKYGDFVERADRLSFDINNFSNGAMRFIIGALKCIAISAVLEEAYQTLDIFSSVQTSITMILILMIINGIKIFYFFSGYSDMARGIASMFGIRIQKDYGGCFNSVTPCDYIRNFCSGLLGFCRAYITVPVTKIVSGISGNAVAAVFAAFLYSLIFAGNIETLFFLFVPMTAAMLFIVFRTGKKRSPVRPDLRILGSAITFITVCFVWWFTRVGSYDRVIRTLIEASDGNPFYIHPRILTVVIDLKHIVLPIATGICIRIMSKLTAKEGAYLDSLQSVNVELAAPAQKTVATVCKYVISLLLLVAFFFTVILLLPQYPEYASASYFFPFL